MFANYCRRLFDSDGNDCGGRTTSLPTTITTISPFSVIDAVVIVIVIVLLFLFLVHVVVVAVAFFLLFLPPTWLLQLILLLVDTVRISNTKRCRQTSPVPMISTRYKDGGHTTSPSPAPISTLLLLLFH